MRSQVLARLYTVLTKRLGIISRSQNRETSRGPRHLEPHPAPQAMSNRTLLTILYAFMAVGYGAWVWWVFWSGYGDPVGDSIWLASLLAIFYITARITQRWTRKQADADKGRPW